MPLTFAERRRRRWPRVLGALVVVGAISAGTMYVLGNRRSGPPPLPSTELRRFLTAWSAGDAPGMAAYLETAPPDLATTATVLVRGVPGNRADYARTSLTRDRVGGTATATYHARVDLAGFGPLEWNGTLTWVRVKSGKTDVWRIRWRPDLLFPQLAAGQLLAEQIHWPARASIFAADGSLLAGAQSVVVIGLEPDRVSAQLPQIKQLLQTLVGTDPASVDAALHAPGVRPNFFVPVATVPDDARYTTVIRPQLYPIPGVFFRRTSGVLAAPSAGLAAQAIGRVGEITAQRLRELGAPYRAGDQVGLSGLQASFEKRLAGAPSADVVVLAGSKVVRVVKRFPGRPAQPVRLTIDPR
ncbi:MAG TPA: NTF2-like N-terminal transpeptidase domain-containing protein, partial [Acidimicrobiia bacterium]|nr:NTF2-like N-terminal transpeptidase domain-containing protein [Acidimicrobiia bacterium]